MPLFIEKIIAALKLIEKLGLGSAVSISFGCPDINKITDRSGPAAR